jgi:hypothetical protein
MRWPHPSDSMRIFFNSNRWSWIQRAVVEYHGFFKNKFSHASNKEKLIGVYGPTQVGKTTLILNILGIRESYLEKVSLALRGNSQLGNSATVTATIYGTSADQYFWFEVSGSKPESCVTLDELSGKLATLRERIESLQELQQIQIEIRFPYMFFDEELIKSGRYQVKIIDLPGDKSRNKKETRYVEHCLDAYLQRCEMILLVEISGQILNLLKNQRIPISSWSKQPFKYKVIILRAYTSDSVIEKFDANHIREKEDLVQGYKDEFERMASAKDGIKKLGISVYPFEFGGSLHSLKEQSQTVYQLATSWNREFLKDLYKELEEVENPIGSLRSLLELEALLRSKWTKHCQEFLSERAKLIKALAHQKNIRQQKLHQRQVMKEQSETNKKYWLKRHQLISELQSEFGEAKKRFFQPFVWADVHSSLHNAKSLQLHYEQMFEKMRSWYLPWLAQLPGKIRVFTRKMIVNQPSINFRCEPKKPSFDMISENNYWIHKYFKQTTFESDSETCANRWHNYFKTVQETIFAQLIGYFLELQKIIDEQDKAATAQIAKIDDELTKLPIFHLQTQLMDIKQSYQTIANVYRRDWLKAKSPLLQILLQQYFAVHLQKWKFVMNQSTRRFDTWLSYQMLNIACRDYQNVIHEVNRYGGFVRRK